jgi:hypothetical protein
MDGDLVDSREYPFDVSLYRCQPECQLQCMGALTAPDVVLMAGPCLYKNTKMTKSGMPLKAPLDRVFLAYANNQPRRNVRRASTHMYGEIRHDKDYNDIAQVFLE